MQNDETITDKPILVLANLLCAPLTREGAAYAGQLLLFTQASASQTFSIELIQEL